MTCRSFSWHQIIDPTGQNCDVTPTYRRSCSEADPSYCSTGSIDFVRYDDCRKLRYFWNVYNCGSRQCAVFHIEAMEVAVEAFFIRLSFLVQGLKHQITTSMATNTTTPTSTPIVM